MDTRKIDSMLKKQANMLYSKGIAANSYHKIILPIVFIKFLTSKVENDWKTFAKNKNLIDTSENYKRFLQESEFEENFISIDYEYLWTKILKTSTNEIKTKLDGVFLSLEKYENRYKKMSIFSFSSSNIPNSYISKQVEFIENNYEYDENEWIDLFGYIYEYFLEKYNVKQGRGGEFYTPHSIVKLMVNVTEERISKTKKEIKIYDPTLGSGGMLTQSLLFLTQKWKDVSNVLFFGQEILEDTWNMSKMNFLLRTQSWDFGNKAADTFLEDQFQDIKFDIILSNPPFNVDFLKVDYETLENNKRFEKYGIIFGAKKANFNFFTHIISHLSNDGIAAVLMQPSTGQTTNNLKEVEIRKKYIKENIVEGIINLPQNIFTNSPIGANIWIFNKNKKHQNILFVDLSNSTKKKNKIETIEDDIIKLSKELFTQFVNFKTTKKIKSSIPFAIVSNKKILKDEYARLNINEHIKVNKKNKIISKEEITMELKKLKNDLEKTFNDIEKTINYLIKD